MYYEADQPGGPLEAAGDLPRREQRLFHQLPHAGYLRQRRSLSSMWKGYDIPVVKFDGNDIISVLEAVETAVERAREGKGPSVLEGVTYRISAHIPMEAQFEYRTVDEVNEWREKDPIPAQGRGSSSTACGIWSRTRR